MRRDHAFHVVDRALALTSLVRTLPRLLRSILRTSQDVEVTHCVVSTGFKEDALAVKSGEGEFGLLLNAPSRCGGARS